MQKLVEIFLFLAVFGVSFSGFTDGYVLLDQKCLDVAKYPVTQSEVSAAAKTRNIGFNEAMEYFVEREFTLLSAMNNPLLSFASIKEMAVKHLETVMKENRQNREQFEKRLHLAPYFTTYEALEREITYQILLQKLISEKKSQEQNSSNELDKDRDKMDSTKNDQPGDIENKVYRRMIWEGIKAKYNVGPSLLSAKNNCR